MNLVLRSMSIQKQIQSTHLNRRGFTVIANASAPSRSHMANTDMNGIGGTFME